MLYIGGYTLLDGDILHLLVDVSNDRNILQVNQDFNNSLPYQTEIAGIDTQSSDRYVDAIKTIFPMFKLFINFFFAPIALVTDKQLALPASWQLMLGVIPAFIIIALLISWIFNRP